MPTNDPTNRGIDFAWQINAATLISLECMLTLICMTHVSFAQFRSNL